VGDNGAAGSPSAERPFVTVSVGDCLSGLPVKAVLWRDDCSSVLPDPDRRRQSPRPDLVREVFIARNRTSGIIAVRRTGFDQ
jgi:hypothetical protein